MKNIKLMWQFSGPDSLKIAEHHLNHLSEYMIINNIVLKDKAVESINDFSVLSFIIVDQSYVKKLSIDLRPHKVILIE